MNNPIWIRCEACDDWWCTVHELHVFECECPPLEFWMELDLDPYEGSIPFTEDAETELD